MDYEVGAKLRTEPVWVTAGVVLPGGGEDDAAENQILPAGLAAQPGQDKSPAQWAYERLILYIQKFEEQMDPDQEVAMGFAGSEAGSLHIHGLGFFAPDIITFYGAGPDGSKTQLVQHVSQLNVMLRSAPKLQEKPVRIGFEMRKRLETEASETGGTDAASG